MASTPPGIHTIDLEFTIEGETRAIHPAFVETDDGVVLVDTGMPDHVGDVAAALDSPGFDLGDVDLVALTHEDYDHAGGVSEVVQRADAAVLASHGSAPYVRGDEELLKSGFGSYPSARVDVELVGDVEIPTVAGPMVVVETPGHTPGHISYYFPDERFLLAGDALTAMDGLGGPAEEFTLDMAAATRSVGRLAELEIERTLCYHGGFVEHDPERVAAIHRSLQGT